MTWEDFRNFAAKLKPYAERVMKIEVAPWIEDYIVDMNDLFTELILEKLKNKPAGLEVKLLKNYEDLFKGYFQGNKNCHGNELKSSDEEKEEKQLDQVEVQKILGKGDPGIGKTTLIKKIGYDWGKGDFTNFVAVIVILLKLVRPGDSIEKAILQQVPELEGITEEFLKKMMKTYEHQCLLILDGLDEHSGGENNDVHKIIRGQKMPNCNIMVTSRPHSIREVEKYFNTVVRVAGFTRDEAFKFAYKILQDKEKVELILNFNPADFRADEALYKLEWEKFTAR